MSSIAQELNGAFTGRQIAALNQLFQDYRTVLLAMAAKLDADAGVTDTNFAALLQANAAYPKD